MIKSRAVLMTGLVVLAAVAVQFSALGFHSSLNSHEAYAAVPARTMYSSGDWVMPQFGGLARLQKPPLGYWTIAAAGAVTGGDFDEFVARLPSALAALALTLLVGLWAKRWYGGPAGVAAALVQATSVHSVFYGRRATVDMVLCLLIVLALYLIVDDDPNHSRRSRFLRWTCIDALIGLAWLAKFHYGPSMIVGVAAVHFAAQRRYRELVRFLNPIGIVLIAICVFAWPMVVLKSHPEAWSLWWRETFGRAVGQMDADPFWHYLPYLPLFLLPWTLVVPFAVHQRWRKAWIEKDSKERFLWIWFATIFVLISISEGKRKHYLLPALPMFSLICGPYIAGVAARIRSGQPIVQFGRRSSLAIQLAFGLIVTAGCLFAWDQFEGISPWVLVVIGGAIYVATWALARACRSIAPDWNGIVAVVASIACFICISTTFVPACDAERAVIEFGRRVRRTATSGAPIYIYGHKQHAAAFYLGDPVRRLPTQSHLEACLRQRQPALIVVEPGDLPVVEAIGNAERLDSVAVRSRGTPTDDVAHVLLRVAPRAPYVSAAHDDHAVR